LGTGWGEQGFGYLPYEYLEKYMDDAWSFKFASAQAENSK
jgi:C1A family cysteine protease